MYYNIHTHTSSRKSEVIEIVNVIVGKDAEKVKETSFRSCGIHPWYIYNVEEQLEELRLLAAQEKTVAIGEAGLDKLTDTPFDLQEEIFRQQILLSETLGKPMIIHCVKAWQELIAIYKEMKPTQNWGIHGFRGKPELAEQLIAQGFYLSFGAHFNPEALQKALPARILAETDEAETTIQEVYQLITNTLHLSPEAISSLISDNWHSFFR